MVSEAGFIRGTAAPSPSEWRDDFTLLDRDLDLKDLVEQMR